MCRPICLFNSPTCYDKRSWLRHLRDKGFSEEERWAPAINGIKIRTYNFSKQLIHNVLLSKRLNNLIAGHKTLIEQKHECIAGNK